MHHHIYLKFQELEHVPTYEPFMIQPTARELAGGSQPCLFLASSDFDAAQLPPDIDNRITSDTVHSVGVHQKDPTVRSRASSSQSHVLPSKHGAATYVQDASGRPESSTQHGRKKSSTGSLKRAESAKPEGRHKQKSSSKKGHVQTEKVFRRSESFTAASRGGTEPVPRDRRISSQQGNTHEYEYKDRLDDSEIERMVLPPPPPLNIESRGVEFNGLSNTLPGLDHHQIQMPPSGFNTDSVISFQEEQLKPHQEPITSSPLAVIRRKRANQANWEKTRKHSLQKTTEKEVTSFALRKTVFSGRFVQSSFQFVTI